MKKSSQTNAALTTPDVDILSIHRVVGDIIFNLMQRASLNTLRREIKSKQQL